MKIVDEDESDEYHTKICNFKKKSEQDHFRARNKTLFFRLVCQL